LGNSPSPLLPDTEIPEGVDYLVMESVYGDRNHETKDERRSKLKEVILEGIKKDGAIILPAFSIERTQVLLYEINNMIEDKEIPEISVYVDSPHDSKVTYIYKKYADDFKENVREEIKKGDDIFDFPGLKIVGRSAESRELEKTKGAKIILAGSGMSEGGRVVNHEAHYLPDPSATIVLVGYQSVGTLGRKLQDGEKEVFVSPPLNISFASYHKRGEKIKIKVKAKIENILGYSSHKDSDHLVEFVEQSNSSQPSLKLREGAEQKPKLKKVFVILGEPKSSLFLTQRIREYLDIDAVYPEAGKEYEIN